jgi:hypothetical protein
MSDLHLGLLITKDDDEIIGPWFRENVRFFDEIVCLDGSHSDHARKAAAAEPNVIYVHECDCGPLQRTDHGLREAAHRILIRRHGYDGWVTLCHADEFFYHDPRKCCRLAEARNCDGVYWYALHFLPHPTELAHRDYLRALPAHLRFQHYHWDYEGTGIPWQEFRSFRNHDRIQWYPQSHGSPQPDGCTRFSDFHPAYRHFKIFSLDPTWYEPAQGWTQFAHHWQHVATGQTGICWMANSIEELFVENYHPYRKCDRFDGVFDHPWNMGDSYR